MVEVLEDAAGDGYRVMRIDVAAQVTRGLAPHHCRVLGIVTAGPYLDAEKGRRTLRITCRERTRASR